MTVLSMIPLSNDICYRDFIALDEQRLNVHLEPCNWAVTDSSTSLEDMVNCVCSHIASGIDIAVPIIIVSTASKRKPWFTDRILNYVNVRYRLYRIYKRVRFGEALLEHHYACDCAHRAVEEACQAFIQTKLESLIPLKSRRITSLWRDHCQ